MGFRSVLTAGILAAGLIGLSACGASVDRTAQIEVGMMISHFLFHTTKITTTGEGDDSSGEVPSVNETRTRLLFLDATQAPVRYDKQSNVRGTNARPSKDDVRKV